MKSPLFNLNIYQYNWLWIDDFTDANPISESEDFNKVQGLDLGFERKWDLYATTANSNFNHYTFAITQKLLSVSPVGVDIL